MANVRKGKECIITLPNERGAGAKLLETVAKAGVNLNGIVGYEMGPNEACIHVVADDYDKACSAIQNAGYSCQGSDVLLVDVPNAPGSCAEILKKLADEGVDVEYCNATALEGRSLFVIKTKDNDKALAALS
ncbi:MAG TPA: hypothetical protein VNK96_00255 [Fimbriimonadales bacterium]|nr:hypothetical protein [Fimbriimonadales bacterium]